MVRSCDRVQGVASDLVLIPESKRLTLLCVADLYVAFFRVGVQGQGIPGPQAGRATNESSLSKVRVVSSRPDCLMLST
jgi:hypothetical protein